MFNLYFSFTTIFGAYIHKDYQFPRNVAFRGVFV